MKPHGIIYQAPSFKKRLFFGFMRIFGASLVTFAVVGVIFSFYPIVKEEFLYRFGTKNQIALNKFSEIIGRSQATELGLDPYFSLYIPKIAARAKVIPNVDPGDAKSYLTALSEGVAHAKGTNFPGTGKTIYLFSHSTDSPVNITRYNAVFFLLGKLSKGDRIVIYFLNQEHDYVVTDKFVTAANDTSWLKDDGGGERLILQTCDPPGTSWNRLLVVARPI